ncbi:hypothetical protein ANCDUO_06638 [Ancylostoma duodenale]|uniref:E3 ubiquitin-protein ligase listerin HEAT-repeats region domain-containing protein n=1 Tax=Ancylostoma duodenale TaxID=51022 RepID=A0A0C2DKJ5_9BILA|nr:hypothetical protein ANCDUO_06638 [Ancylostoma duodenale]
MDGSEWEDIIFNAKSLGTPSWRMSVLCLRAAISVFDDKGSISSMSSELLDFVMCGLVTAFDSCDDALGSQVDYVRQLEALAGLALEICTRVFNHCVDPTRVSVGHQGSGTSCECDGDEYVTIYGWHHVRGPRAQ